MIAGQPCTEGDRWVRRGGTVEADETYVGRKPGTKVRAGAGHKEYGVLAGRAWRKVRSQQITGKAFDGIKAALKANVSPEAILMTDQAQMYRNIAKAYADHQTVNHSAGEYVRGDAYTNYD